MHGLYFCGCCVQGFDSDSCTSLGQHKLEWRNLALLSSVLFRAIGLQSHGLTHPRVKQHKMRGPKASAKVISSAAEINNPPRSLRWDNAPQCLARTAARRGSEFCYLQGVLLPPGSLHLPAGLRALLVGPVSIETPPVCWGSSSWRWRKSPPPRSHFFPSVLTSLCRVRANDSLWAGGCGLHHLCGPLHSILQSPSSLQPLLLPPTTDPSNHSILHIAVRRTSQSPNLTEPNGCGFKSITPGLTTHMLNTSIMHLASSGLTSHHSPPS